MQIRKKQLTEPEWSIPDMLTGLNERDVRERTEAGYSNRTAIPKTKSIPCIVREHLMTLFNLINLLMALALVLVNSLKNALFFGVVVCNVAIGIFQELRAKRATDKLSVLAAASVTVRRERREKSIPAEELVYGDIVLLRPGEQVPAGCRVICGACEVSEALLTGESEPIAKGNGDALLSGSFIVSGECAAVVLQVGKDSLLQEIAAGAKQYRKKNSEIIRALSRIVDVVAFLAIPYAVIFFFIQQKRASDLVFAVRTTVAAIVGMIPEGLILLVSGVMALAVYRLSKKNILVKELYSVETLARVDTLCLDKTGTLTDGKLTVASILPLRTTEEEVLEALTILARNTSGNETIAAVSRFCAGREAPAAAHVVPFSGKKKYSIVYSDEGKAYILGAPEYLLTAGEQEFSRTAETLAEECRVLCVSVADTKERTETLPEPRRAIGLVMLTDTLRAGASETVAFFLQQGVQIKLISGDHPATVSRIARGAGIPHYDRFVDLSAYAEDADYGILAQRYTIFGRATPVQKQLLIRAMKQNGQTVAMTGDGVNDVLALREADCSIAINDGADAARNVSDIVLLGSDYRSLPQVVAEGRSAINNLSQSASLFLTKTIYSILLGILFLFLPGSYPFIPIQLTLISSLTVAIPSLLFSLRSSQKRVQGNFLKTAFYKALPGGVAIVAGVVFASQFGHFYPIPQTDISTICAFCTAICAICGLLWIIQPPDRIQVTIVCAVGAVYLFCAYVFRDLFEMNLTRLSSSLIGVASLAVALAAFLLVLLLQNGYARLHLEKYVIRLLKVIRYFTRKINAHHVGACAAQVAFFMLFAIVPLLILLFSLTGFFSISAEEFLGEYTHLLPSIVGSLFQDVMQGASENSSSVMTSFSALAVIWSASKGVYYIIGGLNSVFEVKESRNLLKVRALSIFYTFAFILILIAVLLSMVFGNFIAGFLSVRFPSLSGLMNALSSLRFVIGLLLLTLFFALLFKVLPDRKTTFAAQFPGAVISAVGWVLFSFFFSFYVNNFSNYANIYGSLAAIIVFMLWLYICMFILFFGAELNLLIEKTVEE